MAKIIDPSKIKVDYIKISDDEPFKINKSIIGDKIYFPVDYNTVAVIYSDEDYTHDDLGEAFVMMDPSRVDDYMRYDKKKGVKGAHYKDYFMDEYGAITVESVVSEECRMHKFGDVMSPPAVYYNIDLTPRPLRKVLEAYRRSKGYEIYAMDRVNGICVRKERSLG